MTLSLLRRLALREQDLSTFSMCEPDKNSVQAWLSGLPAANIGISSKQLYTISEELLRLRLEEPEARLELLELIAPAIENTLNLLSSHYQHKQALLPQNAQRVVDLTHTMRMNLANCYTIAAVELVNTKSGLLRRPNRTSINEAIYGALKQLHQNLLLCYQLYSAAPRTLWLKVHQLYLFACSMESQSLPIESSDDAKQTIRNLYAQIILLGSIKANQLRQDDLMRVVKLIPEWLEMVQLTPYSKDEIPALFMIDSNADRGPVYSHLLNKTAVAKCELQFSTSGLVQEIRKLVDSSTDADVEVNGQSVNVDLLNHLILAWGKCTKRSFMRIESEEQLDICVGLGAAHSFASGDSSYESMVDKASQALARDAELTDVSNFDVSRQSVSDDANADNDSERFAATDLNPESRTRIEYDPDSMECIDYNVALPGQMKQSKFNNDASQDSVRVKINNASPGGYSLTVPDTDNLRIHAGDLIGIKDIASEMWSIATIRWLHRPSSTELTFGVELLSPAYMPSVARSVETAGKPSECFPVLLLPEVSVTGQAASLLISDVNISTGDTMQVLDRDEVRIVKVTDQLAKTRVYAQYSYESFDAANDGEEAEEDVFEELWAAL